MVRSDLLGDARRGDRQRHPPAAPLGRHEVEHHEERPVVLDDPAPLVDQGEPLADRVEPHTERGPRRGDDLTQPHQSGASGLGGLGGA